MRFIDHEDKYEENPEGKNKTSQCMFTTFKRKPDFSTM